MTALTIDDLCLKYEEYETYFNKNEGITKEYMEEYLDTYIKWKTLTDVESVKDCELDGIFAFNNVVKRLNDYPSLLCRLYFTLNQVDDCLQTLKLIKHNEKTKMDHLLNGLCYMLVNQYRLASQAFLLGDYTTLASIMRYYLGEMDFYTNSHFKDATYLTKIFQDLDIKVIQNNSLVVFAGDAEEGLLLRKCLGYFKNLIGDKQEICKVGQLTMEDYHWMLEVAERNDIAVQ